MRVRQVVDRHNAVVGIITRKDLARMQHNKHGQGFPSSPSSRPPSRRSSVSSPSEGRPAELATPGSLGGAHTLQRPSPDGPRGPGGAGE